jgi:hypothetical protein
MGPAKGAGIVNLALRDKVPNPQIDLLNEGVIRVAKGLVIREGTDLLFDASSPANNPVAISMVIPAEDDD